MTIDQIDELLSVSGLNATQIHQLVGATLDEDLSWGPDVTTSAIFPETSMGHAAVACRQGGTIAGLPVAALAWLIFATRNGLPVDVELAASDGDQMVPGQQVLHVKGALSCLLTAERSALNFLGQLSGVATATAGWVRALAGTAVRVRDTRKTVPGLRMLQKYAVRCGGGTNHRMGLGDAALIKDNHIAAAGSVRAAFDAVRAYAPNIPIEVECDTPEQVAEAIAAGAEFVLLDNMTAPQMTQACSLAKASGVATEASGGLRLCDAAQVAATGVDFVAVGALTHSAPVLDFGLDFISP